MEKYCFHLIWSIDQAIQTLTFWKSLSFLICMGKTCPQKPPKTPEKVPCDLAVWVFFNYMHMLSHFSHVWLFATPWTVVHQAPLSMGFSSQDYWSLLQSPSPGDLWYCVVGIVPWRRERLPTPVFWPGEFHGLYSPFGVAKGHTQQSDFHSLVGYWCWRVGLRTCSRLCCHQVGKVPRSYLLVWTAGFPVKRVTCCFLCNHVF